MLKLWISCVLHQTVIAPECLSSSNTFEVKILRGKKTSLKVGTSSFLPFPFEQVVNYFPSPPPSGFSSKIFHEIPEIPRLVQRMRGRLWSSTMNHQSTRQTLMSDGKPPLESLSAVCEIDFSHHVTAFSRFINQPGW